MPFSMSFSVRAIRSRQLGRGADLLVGGIQPAVPDVVRHSAGEEVRILEHHAQ